MITFERLYETAVLHKGGEKHVQVLLPHVKSKPSLIATDDAEYLSIMSRRVFRAGLKHALVDKKWPAFHKAFKDFNPLYCSMLSDEKIDELMQDATIIRHLRKVQSVRHNAAMVVIESKKHQGFGRFLADWPESEIVDLWRYFKKWGKQLGGYSGPQFLRMAGKDTFLLSQDVIAVLKAHDVITKEPTSIRDLHACQAVFNDWQEQSGRPLCEISRIVSFCAMT